MPKKKESIHNQSNLLPLINGFTLLEVMVALAVITTVLVSVYQLHAQSLSLALETRFYSRAPFLAQQTLSEMTSGAGESLESGSGDFGEDFPGMRWEFAVEPVESDLAEKVPIQLMKIDITISDAGDAFHYTMRTYRWVKS
ncbi:MAG: hypothetical protein DSY90_11080 [Deltaproteobacteria bacterium]|nr:MAG: hypothetical protein DSY90_11080 [Deltaproteobacteria bacterium]